MSGAVEKTLKARKAFHASIGLEVKLKNKALLEIAKTIEKNKKKILEANKKDVRVAERNKITKTLIARLKLNEQKIKTIAYSVRSVVKLDNPIGKTLEAKELDKNLVLYKVSTPIGVIACIFESRPDVVPQIASLCLKSGNSVIMKGGSEALNSNRILYK